MKLGLWKLKEKCIWIIIIRLKASYRWLHFILSLGSLYATSHGISYSRMMRLLSILWGVSEGRERVVGCSRGGYDGWWSGNWALINSPLHLHPHHSSSLPPSTTSYIRPDPTVAPRVGLVIMLWDVWLGMRVVGVSVVTHPTLSLLPSSFLPSLVAHSLHPCIWSVVCWRGRGLVGC